MLAKQIVRILTIFCKNPYHFFYWDTLEFVRTLTFVVRILTIFLGKDTYNIVVRILATKQMVRILTKFTEEIYLFARILTRKIRKIFFCKGSLQNIYWKHLVVRIPTKRFFFSKGTKVTFNWIFCLDFEKIFEQNWKMFEYPKMVH